MLTKTLTTSFYLLVLLIYIPASGQLNYQSCRRCFIETATLMPRLYEENKFDSIQYYYDRKQVVCKYSPHIFCLKILLSIETGRFDRHDILPGLYSNLGETARIIRKIKQGKGCDGYYSGKYFNGCEYAYPIFTLIDTWASRLINTRKLDSGQLFLCRLMTGEITNPLTSLTTDPAAAIMDSSLLKAFDLQRKIYNHDVSIVMGTWIPTNTLKVIGIHPDIALQMGWRHEKNEINFIAGGRFLNAMREYNILYHDTLYASSHIAGGYCFISYTQYFLHRPHIEAGPLAGAGVDGYEVKYTGPVNTKISRYPSSYNFACTAGFAVNYFYGHYNPHCHVGLSFKYNLLPYQKLSGAGFTGHAFTISIVFGTNN